MLFERNAFKKLQKKIIKDEPPIARKKFQITSTENINR